MRKIIILCLALAFAGCSTKTSSQNIQESSASLVKGEHVYIALPEDGAFAGKVSTGSGMQTAQLAAHAINRYSYSLVSLKHESESEAVQSTANQGCRYLFYMYITNWEERAAAWSGKPTQVSIEVKIFDLERSGVMPAIHTELNVKGRALTLRSQTPEEVARILLDEYTSGLYQ